MIALVDPSETKHLHNKVRILTTSQPAHYGTQINKLSALLQLCVNESNLVLGRELHCLIVQKGLQSNTFLGSFLIRLFSVCERLLEADLVFNKLHEPNVFAWSEIISAHANYGLDSLAFCLFRQMVQAPVQPDGHAYVAALKTCTSAETLLCGLNTHFHIMGSAHEADLFVGNALINMYAKCGALKDACIVFNNLAHRDVVSWSTLIGGYAQHMCCQEAMVLFEAMQREGIEPNNVAWNAIIFGYAQSGECEEALYLYNRMLLSGRQPDNFTFVSVLNACSDVAAIDQGRLIHADVTESGYGSDVFIRSTLIDMYAKGGSLEDGRSVFTGDKVQNAVTWTAMMAAHALQSDYTMVLHYFKEMQQEGWSPNEVTFVCLLGACGHMGLVEDALQHFSSMRKVYGIDPTQEHYNSLLDLLGRAGLFNEINELFESMPEDPNSVGWTSLLNSCRIFGNVDLGISYLDHVDILE